MKSTVPERVALMMKELNVDQVELADIAGATKSVVNQWLSGKIKSIGPAYAYNIQKKKGYSAEWIQTGEGEGNPFYRNKRTNRERAIQEIVRLLRQTDDIGINVVLRSAQSASEDFSINKQVTSSQ